MTLPYTDTKHISFCQVDLKHLWTDKFGLKPLEAVVHGMDMKNYYQSQEWDVLAVPANKTNKYYTCCAEPFPDITFNITMRRKTLFYTINLIIPCFSINMLTCLTFYLPSQSAEKISLSISILLSLSIFQILMMDLVPATSWRIPLLGKYILFTMILVSLSVFISVVTLNGNFRSSATTNMSQLTQKIFLEIMPSILLMNRLHLEKDSIHEDSADFSSPSSTMWNSPEYDIENITNFSASSTFIGVPSGSLQNLDLSAFCGACAKKQYHKLPLQVQRANEGVVYVDKHVKEETETNKVTFTYLHQY